MPKPSIQLISTDFDFTLVNHDDHRPFVPELIETIHTLRSHGVYWLLNTGRSPWWFREGMTVFDFPILPDFVVTSERDLFQIEGSIVAGWSMNVLTDWNERCATDHRHLFQHERELFRTITDYLKKHTMAELLFETDAPRRKDQIPTGIAAQDEEEAQRVAEFVETLMGPDSDLSYQRNLTYLRFCHKNYSKGSAMNQLAKHLGLAPEAVFAVGDQHNDLSMLDGRFAWNVACPYNAIASVKNVVASLNGNARGYVAKQPCSGGVVEALKYFFPNHLPSRRSPH